MIGWMIHFAAEFVEFFDTKKWRFLASFACFYSGPISSRWLRMRVFLVGSYAIIWWIAKRVIESESFLTSLTLLKNAGILCNRSNSFWIFW
jgi:hypothetical protein